MFSKELSEISESFLNNKPQHDYRTGEYIHRVTGYSMMVKKITGKYITIIVQGMEAVRAIDILEMFDHVDESCKMLQ